MPRRATESPYRSTGWARALGPVTDARRPSGWADRHAARMRAREEKADGIHLS